MTARPPGIRPGTIWITGLSASGKTTLAEALSGELQQRGYRCAVLDGEAVRRRMGGRHGHTLAGRFAALRDIVAVALAEQRDGAIPIVATISHKREMRAFARQILGRMIEVYLDCPAAICAARDAKGHYRRAYAGEYECFIGVTEPYEAGDAADLVIDTAHSTVAEAHARLLTASLAFLTETTAPRGAPLR